MSGRLINALGAAMGTAEAFSDVATLRHMLRFEAALTRAVADAGLIPKKHVRPIEQACDPALYDCAVLVDVARRNLTLTVAARL
jgi:3-carboxy-cis,cis-muconate cycloisomerase